MSDDPYIHARFPVEITADLVRCPLCGHFLMPSLLALHGGQWYQIHYFVTNLELRAPTFCTGHSKYDPVFSHVEHAEQQTPIPDVFRDAFDQEVPGD